MNVSYSYLSQVSSGSRPWTPMMRERAAAVLGHVPGQGVVYRQGGRVSGESSYIRERAREVGLSMGELADRVGVSLSYLSRASRGKQNLGPEVQALVEAKLQAPVKVEAAPPPTVDPQVLWDRMVMNGNRAPSGNLLRKLHGVLFRPTEAELVAPVELRVMVWKKDDRNGVVVQGAGGPGGGTLRTGGRVPWGAEVEFAYTSGYDNRGRVSVTHLVDERGCSVMLKDAERGGA